jgi:hypothetical protein
MPMIDPQDADLSKVTASLVRDARSLLRRADKLASAVTAADDTTTTLAAGSSAEADDRRKAAVAELLSRAERWAGWDRRSVARRHAGRSAEPVAD